MKKTIVFCADGTWNGPDEDPNDDKKGTPTNVFKLFLNLSGDLSIDDLRHANEQEKVLVDSQGNIVQIAKYLHGVGDSDNFLVKMLGGVAGMGLITRVIRGYTFISRNYSPNDDVVLIGFSRGAYTVRTLGGLICSKGLLDKSKEDLSNKEDSYRKAAAVWGEYRREAIKKTKNWFFAFKQILADLPGFFSQAPTAVRIADVPIAAVAVWDTVGSLGIPQYAIDRDKRIDTLQFCDTKLSEKVALGLHAIAIDEQRIDFTPTLWDADGNRIVQAAFPGAHADVGGGYSSGESGLSDCALKWMTKELEKVGVVFSKNPSYAINADPLGVSHKPWSDPPFNLSMPVSRGLPNGLAIHQCLKDRMSGGGAQPYLPRNLPNGAFVIPW